MDEGVKVFFMLLTCFWATVFKLLYVAFVWADASGLLHISCQPVFVFFSLSVHCFCLLFTKMYTTADLIFYPSTLLFFMYYPLFLKSPPNFVANLWILSFFKSLNVSKWIQKWLNGGETLKPAVTWTALCLFLCLKMFSRIETQDCLAYIHH